jgi:amino acid adenylation domain-containing protein
MIIGLMGILKAGGGYVPLDVMLGNGRLALMLQDAQVPVVVTQQKLAEQLPKHTAERVCIDEDWERIAKESDERPSGEVTPENVAYVIFTSGSTGTPKGVVIEHRQISNYVRGIWQRCNLEPGLNFAMVQPLVVDSSQTVLFPSLLSGGCLVLVPPEKTLEPQALKEYFSRCPVDVLKIAPSHLAALLASPHPEQILPRRWLILGGEASRRDWVDEVQAVAPCTIFNHYGPTETTVGVLTHQMNVSENDHGSLTVPIGRPLSHTQAFLLDDRLQPVPAGAPGELYIGGRGLARCYLGRPEITAEKFVPHPFSDERGARLYKTGDVARYLPDGNIEFLGRNDDQVKIRGFRVELGEIEAALIKHPAIRQAVVLPRKEQPGDKCLVAYVVPRDSRPSLSEIREFLKEKLPDYMVPSALLVLAALPLTPQGKIDRLTLPSPDNSTPEKPFVASQTPVEEVVAGIWSEVLGVENVSLHDNFFDLGGHSLKAIQIIAAVREAFHIELPLRSLLETPTMSVFAGDVEAAMRMGERLQFSSIERIPREADLPLSFSQERAWFIQQLKPLNLAYNSQVALWFRGRLDVVALERSLSEIVRRHEIYRTTFPAVNGRAVQVIHKAQPLRLPVIELELPQDVAEAEARRLISQELRKPFDLTQLPLARWTLLRLSADKHVLVHVDHHLVHDGWSIHVFLRELMELYKAFAAGNSSPLPELPIQFVDFAQWQRQWAKQPEAEEQLTYWKANLAGAPPVLTLPSDRPRPAVQTFRGAQEKVEIPLELCESLRARSRQENATLFMTMLTAFLALLYRYTGQKDICVGSGVANRRSRQIEGLIGMIINNVVLRTDLSGEPTFRELLVRVRRVALEAYARQDIPFDKVVEAVRPMRDLSYNPLFQVMFSFQDTPLPQLKFPGLSVTLDRPLSNGSAKFDLNIVIFPRYEQRVGANHRAAADKMIMMWEYSTDLFDPNTVQRMMGHYQILLREIGAAPEQCIARLPLLTEPERHKIVVEWNDTKKDYPKDDSIHKLFERQVERSPDAIAVVLGDKQLTYRELNRRANQLAHYLRKLGVGPDVLAGICMERSPEMIIALLGILKAGGAYVPLDPSYPEKRLAFILANTRAPIVLTQQQLIENLPGNASHLIRLDTVREVIAAENENNPVSTTTTDNLAYVIYTSGSTGKPKGVGVPHKGVVRLVKEANYAELTERDVFLQLAPVAFDASTFEIWGCLLNGGQLVVFPPYRPSLEDLGNTILRSQVTILWLTSALFHAMVENRMESLRNVKQLLAGGEVLSASHVKKFLETLPNCRLINGYGPTENTTFTCCHPITFTDQVGDSVSIGRPISNTQVYIVDDHLNPVPPGVPGELYAGGDGLARGYFNNPELTAEKFIPNPFSEEPGARLYKTGDLARYLSDGNIEFLGRIDNQVKIRGFRIELGEIEAVLKDHPGVGEAVVAAREDISGNKRLVGYVVNREPVQMVDLRNYLKAKLPDYMVPAAFVFLDSLPLTPSGKIDREALPAPDASRPELENVFVAPRMLTEELVAGTWAEILKLERVGIHDNFFELGGHSLLATQVISRLRESFNVALPLRSIFESPTVAGLAERVETLLWAGDEVRTASEVTGEREEIKL